MLLRIRHRRTIQSTLGNNMAEAAAVGHKEGKALSRPKRTEDLISLPSHYNILWSPLYVRLWLSKQSTSPPHCESYQRREVLHQFCDEWEIRISLGSHTGRFFPSNWRLGGKCFKDCTERVKCKQLTFSVQSSNYLPPNLQFNGKNRPVDFHAALAISFLHHGAAW